MGQGDFYTCVVSVSPNTGSRRLLYLCKFYQPKHSMCQWDFYNCVGSISPNTVGPGDFYTCVGSISPKTGSRRLLYLCRFYQPKHSYVSMRLLQLCRFHQPKHWVKETFGELYCFSKMLGAFFFKYWLLWNYKMLRFSSENVTIEIWLMSA